jgi:hypothetical protein
MRNVSRIYFIQSIFIQLCLLSGLNAFTKVSMLFSLDSVQYRTWICFYGSLQSNNKNHIQRFSMFFSSGEVGTVSLVILILQKANLRVANVLHLCGIKRSEPSMCWLPLNQALRAQDSQAFIGILNRSRPHFSWFQWGITFINRNILISTVIWTSLMWRIW